MQISIRAYCNVIFFLGMVPGGRQAGPRSNGMGRSVYDPNPEDDPFYQKLTSGENTSTTYFKNTRQSKLLNETEQNKYASTCCYILVVLLSVSTDCYMLVVLLSVSTDC